MSTIRERLIELYIQGPAETVHKMPAYQDLLDEHPKDHAFDGERAMIQESRQWVDKALQNQNSYRDEVEKALRLLKRPKVKLDQKNACRDLILGGFSRRWSNEQQQYFREMSEQIMDSLDYFLSFTNHNLTPGQLNQVNKNHKYFISNSMVPGEYERSNLIDRNLVAQTINYLLQGRFTGFYYPDHEENGQETENKLRTNCKRALAFVQLVQKAIFHDDDTSNWCFFEYETVRSHDHQRVIFVMIDAAKIPAGSFYPGFDDWFDATSVPDTLKLDETPTYKLALIKQNDDKIVTKLAEQIQDTVDRIYLGIP